MKSKELTTENTGFNVVGQAIKANYQNLALKGYRVKTPRSRLAKVVNGQDVLNYNLQKKDGTKFASRRRRPGNPENLLRSVLSKPAYQRDNINVGSMLMGAKPINWVTKLTELNKHIKQTPERLRNILGLTHYNEDQVLCVFEYPAGHRVSLKNPTVFDGGLNYIFWSYGKRGSWGRTIDLETSSLGLPEAVHGPIALSSDFGIRLIGRLNKTAPSLNLGNFRKQANSESVAPCRTGCKVN